MGVDYIRRHNCSDMRKRALSTLPSAQPRSGNLIMRDEKSAARGSELFASDWRRLAGIVPERRAIRTLHPSVLAAAAALASVLTAARKLKGLVDPAAFLTTDLRIDS